MAEEDNQSLYNENNRIRILRDYQTDIKEDREKKIRKKKPSKEKQDCRRSTQRTKAEGKKVALTSPPSRLFSFFI